MDKYIVFFDEQDFHIIRCNEDFLLALGDKVFRYEKIECKDEIMSITRSMMEKINQLLPEKNIDIDNLIETLD